MTVIFAAGLAVYENPQVRKWVDNSRRKIAIALHSLGDEITPPAPSGERPPDASTREDVSPDAVERRRKVRLELLERARVLEEKRKLQKEDNGKVQTFDDLVNKDGTLLSEKAAAVTTAAELGTSEPNLRKRHPELEGPVIAGTGGTSELNLQKRNLEPQAPVVVDIASANQVTEESTVDKYSQSSTPTLASSSPPSNPIPARQQPLQIDTEANSNHPSEALIDLTPTTSFSSTAEPELFSFSHHSSQTPPQPHRSVHEWAENTTGAAIFYSSLQLQNAAAIETEDPWAVDASEAGDAASSLHGGSERGIDSWSDVGDPYATPDSWTEAGSVTSEDYWTSGRKLGRKMRYAYERVNEMEGVRG